ncbi:MULTISPECIES: hypothetical protein [Bacillus]|uniref:Uncharacterized protein n=1 Tax=Bacillus glycinifermentans TaxID=1664069 RepID=A0AAJ3YY14_9BACI|nr:MULTISPECIES: hypothetical protein [Bacillus]MDU0072026.1 hypothetical protein [Bacillus sp. IG6]MED8019715.1 hypothetical protein [Bacillus glycinifermentans]QAT65191.1 hypothetical protein EQZ20_09835 [Bacillus glycinifermentans]
MKKYVNHLTLTIAACHTTLGNSEDEAKRFSEYDLLDFGEFEELKEITLTNFDGDKVTLQAFNMGLEIEDTEEIDVDNSYT